MKEEPQECRVVNDDEFKPLITDTTMMRWIVGVISTVLTIGAGWAMKELSAIGQSTTQILEDVELSQIRQQETAERLDRVSERVDRLYQIELDNARAEGSE